MEGRAEPPAGGLLEIPVEMAPVSLQASRKKKNVLTAAIRTALGSPGFILSGEVEIDIEWLVHERERYETLDAPDVDNVLKVTLDALCGPEGVLINDCQVQSILCRWIDWTRSDQRMTIRIRFMQDDWLMKDGLRFVRLLGPLCFPLNSRFPPKVALGVLENIYERFQLRATIAARTGDWHAGQALMSAQQPFHIGRLHGFSVLPLAMVREELLRAIESGRGV